MMFKIIFAFSFVIFIIGGCWNKKELTRGITKVELKTPETKTVLNLNKMKELLSSAKCINSSYVWKGHKDLILTFENNRQLTIKVSNYGNFFYSEELDQYFEIPKNRKQEWNSMINVKEIRM